MINAETFIPELLIDYLESRRTDLEMPVSADLPFYAGIRDGVQAEPCVVVYCDAFTCPHPERMSLSMSATLINARDAEESADESAIAAKIRRALGDIAGFKTWLATLSTEERTGWNITKYLLVGGGIEIDSELAQRRRRTAIECHVITTETAVPEE